MKEPSTFIAQSPTPAQQQSPVPAPPLIQTGIDWTAVLVPLLPAVFTGVITGLIAPVIAPYTKWHLEKKRRRHERRLQLIDTWQSYLQENSDDEHSLKPYTLMSLPSFPAIKRCMSSSQQSYAEYISDKINKLSIDAETIRLVLNTDEELFERWMQQVIDFKNRFFEDKESLNKAIKELAKDESPHIILSLSSTKVMSPAERLIRIFNNYENVSETTIDEIFVDIRINEKILRDCLREALAEIETKWGLL